MNVKFEKLLCCARGLKCAGYKPSQIAAMSDAELKLESTFAGAAHTTQSELASLRKVFDLMDEV